MGLALATTMAVLAAAPAQGPVLAGPAGVAYVTKAGITATAWRVTGPRARPQALLRASNKDVRVDADAQALAVMTHWFTVVAESGQSFAATIGAPLRAVSPVCYAYRLDGAAFGTRVAALGDDCQWSALDVATGAREPMGFDARGSGGPGPEGRRVWTDFDDRSDGGIDLNVAGPGEAGRAVGLDWEDTPAVSITDDGTVVGLTPRRSVVAWAQGAGGVTLVDTPYGARIRGARAVGNRIALLLVPAGHDALTGGQIITTNMEGGDARVVLRGVYAKDQDAFAYDGTTATALVSDCDRFLVVRGTGVPRTRRAHCALKLAAPPRWTRSGLQVALACPGTTCAAASAEVRDAHGRTIGRRGAVDARGFVIPVTRARRTTAITLRVRLRDGPLRSRRVDAR